MKVFYLKICSRLVLYKIYNQKYSKIDDSSNVQLGLLTIF